MSESAEPGAQGSLGEGQTTGARLWTVRHEVRLPDDALVVRGGTLRLSDMDKAVEKALVRWKRPGLSVFAADVDDPKTLLDLVGTRVPHPTVSFTRMGRLRPRFEVEPTLEPPHQTVWLPEEDDREYWLREVRMAFDPPISREGLAGYTVGYC